MSGQNPKNTSAADKTSTGLRLPVMQPRDDSKAAKDAANFVKNMQAAAAAVAAGKINDSGDDDDDKSVKTKDAKDKAFFGKFKGKSKAKATEDKNDQNVNANDNVSLADILKEGPPDNMDFDTVFKGGPPASSK